MWKLSLSMSWSFASCSLSSIMESPCGPQVSQMYSLQQVARVTCNTPQTVSFRLQSLGSVLISLSLCIQAATPVFIVRWSLAPRRWSGWPTASTRLSPSPQPLPSIPPGHVAATVDALLSLASHFKHSSDSPLILDSISQHFLLLDGYVIAPSNWDRLGAGALSLRQSPRADVCSVRRLWHNWVFYFCFLSVWLFVFLNLQCFY